MREKSGNPTAILTKCMVGVKNVTPYIRSKPTEKVREFDDLLNSHIPAVP
jgi:hypothetical protein